MDSAWLDDLSEDWVSQPRSLESPTPSLPSLPSLSNSTSDASREKSSRIPKFDPQNQVWAPPQESNTSPLSERSLNDHNIPHSQRSVRQPSKLRDEITQDLRGRRPSRTLSESTTHSTQYHTVQHKSASLSPRKGNHETPEWKRRLLQGEVAYGEQRDLFSPAGLESIFNPPPPQENMSRKTTTQIYEEQSVMPSSPPPYNRDRIAEQLNVESQIAQDEAQSRKQPRVVNYNMVDEGGSDFSADDISRSSSFQPTKAASQFSRNVSNSISVSRSANIQKPTVEEIRAVSGQSDIRNEEFSPVYVARHNTVEGTIDYGALDLLPRELQTRLEQIREDSPPHSGVDQDDYSEAFMATDTEEFAANAQFVNIRRGGYSQEGSFQQRMLSPSSLPAIDESDMLPEESMQASTPKEFPNIRKTRVSHEFKPSHGTEIVSVAPQTPHGSPTKSGEKSSGGSPLKLFGNYDTFTNQKLLRRLSQFEGDYEKSEIDERPSSQPTNPNLSEINAAPSNPQKVQQSKARGNSRKVNSFGEGDLDTFQFSEPSYNTYGSISEDEDKENVTLPTLDPNTQSKFRFQLDPSPALDGKVIQQSEKYVSVTTSTTKHLISTRKTTRPGTGSSLISSEILSTQVVENLQTPRKRTGDSEGKRLPRSPLKDPTPKRRRTLQQSEIPSTNFDDDSHHLDSVNETHQQMQSILGRKRKDARHSDDQQPADPKVLALRQILRPRTPTPSQRGSVQHERKSSQEVEFGTFENAKLAQARKIAKIQAELDATNPLRASMPLGASQHMLNESRKGSVTTQDFLDEAKKIMAGIRGKARSGLTSLEESESENDKMVSPLNDTLELELEDSYQESTREPFSRPPSREGKPIERLQTQQADPALLDHLRKYQEKSDMDLVIASSIRSLAEAKEASEAARELDRMTDETISRSSGRFLSHGDNIESDPPNTRLSENPDVQRKRKHSTSSAIPGSEDHPEVEFPSHGSSASSGQSTTRSIPTGSSRGSDSRRVIAPHTVSHLIPEQLAGMYLDKDRNIWVKRKSVDTKTGGLDFSPSDETEEDPFGDIPDLSVDETQEFHRIKAVAARKKEALVAEQQTQQGYQTAMKLISQQGPKLLERVGVELPLSSEAPLVSGGKQLSNSSSNQRIFLQSNVARHSSPENEGKGYPHNKLAEKFLQESLEDEVETEISILEDRVDPASPQRRRNVTITFSSPLEQVMRPSGQEDSDVEADEAQSSTLKKHNSAGGSILINKKGSVSKSSTTKIRSALRTSSRRMPLGGHTFSGRPVSRIDENDEESSGRPEDRRRRSVSVAVTTPLPARRETSVVLATPRQVDQIGNLSLTPLSEFTMRQSDESFGLDVSYVDGGQRYMLGANSKRTLSLSIKELVEKITQVEPYEPFWEHLKQLDLKDKRLTTLHKLDEFCEHLEELDASHNQMAQLDGVPVSVRDLRITHNHLSDLAAWGHLTNLQYIDISNNQIESLSGFRSLVHLRGLRADNNQIRSLDGISHLNGLLQLRLRGNTIESLDFAGSRLLRLTDLDLKGNHIYQITNLHELQSLSSLNVEDNNLVEFSMDGPSPLRALRYLKLSGNQLEKLDVSRCPDLRLLYVDRNRLETVSGLLKTKHLDSLSMREQQDGVLIDTSFLSQALEVRKLFLSGNLLTTFQPKVDYLNLQYLELANCGLETLSPEFGCMVANTRVLNLNFNALRDIKPLVGIVRLKKLHLAGNRLSRLRTTTCLLSQFPTLSFADLRNNPLTQGFYPPISDTRLVLHKTVEEEVVGQSFTLGDANRTHDSKYASRLDQHTKMMRRVFEILILSGCKHLKILDGLEVDRSVLVSRDLVWRSLVDAGVLKEEEEGALELETQSTESPPVETEREEDAAVEQSLVSERWQAEDSFA